MILKCKPNVSVSSVFCLGKSLAIQFGQLAQYRSLKSEKKNTRTIAKKCLKKVFILEGEQQTCQMYPLKILIITELIHYNAIILQEIWQSFNSLIKDTAHFKSQCLEKYPTQIATVNVSCPSRHRIYCKNGKNAFLILQNDVSFFTLKNNM